MDVAPPTQFSSRIYLIIMVRQNNPAHIGRSGGLALPQLGEMERGIAV